VLNFTQQLKYISTTPRHYSPHDASDIVPLSAVFCVGLAASTLASSLRFCAANCQLGIAALPFNNLL
jgi:hypothetical protein